MKELSIGFTGDIAFSGYFSGVNPKCVVSEDLKDTLKTCDYTVFNIEGTITDKTSEGVPLLHRNPKQVVPFIQEISIIPIAALANNHMMDFGRDGLSETLETLKSNGVLFMGAGGDIEEASRPIIIEKYDIELALINFTYKNYLAASKEQSGIYSMNDAQDMLKAKVRELKQSGVDWCIAICHTGEEFLHIPMEWTRNMFRGYIESGVDIVVAHHPHVVQGYETYFYKGKPKAIFYSLGNFIFDTDFQRKFQGTDNGLFLQLAFNKKSFEFQSYYTHIDRNRHVVLVGNESPMFKSIKEFTKLDYYEEAGRIKTVNRIRDEIKENGARSHDEVNNLKRIRRKLGYIKRILSDKKERTIFMGIILTKMKSWFRKK